MSDPPIAFEVRDAAVDDLPEIARLYGHYVRDTHATFDLEPPTTADWERILNEQVHGGPHHLLVAHAEQRYGLLGFARTHPFDGRGAYATSARVSVYVAPGAEHQAVGTSLYDELFARVDEGPFHRIYAGIALPNEGSARFHRRYGFEHVGTFTEVGHKLGRYWDVAWYERAVEGAHRLDGDEAPST